MLVVSRKAGDSIIIGDNIEVCILEIGDGTIKIGIEAPRTIKVLRKELIKEVEMENRESLTNVANILKKIR
jgi:carbon storage regulator